MPSTHSRTSRFLQTLQNALLGRGSPSSWDEIQTPPTESVPPSLHKSTSFQTVHNQNGSNETSKLDRGQRITFGSCYNNNYYAKYFVDTGILTLGINGTDIMLLSPEEAKQLCSILNNYITTEQGFHDETEN